MEANFYEYMYAANKSPEKAVADAATAQEDSKGQSSTETIVMDEGIGEWTHKYVVYCKDPKKEFEEELKAKDGVVAVFMKEKKAAPAPAEVNPPNNK